MTYRIRAGSENFNIQRGRGMANDKRQRGAVVIDHPAQSSLDGFSWNGQASDEKLFQALADADDLTEVFLYRQKTQTHKGGMHFCESWSGDIATASTIRQSAKEHIENPYQTTYFRIHIKRDDVLVPNGNLSFAIAGRTPTPEMLAERTSGKPNGNSEILQLVHFLADQAAQDRAMVRELLSARNRTDPKEDFREQLSIMKEMREAMGLPALAAPVSAPAAAVDPLSQLTTQLAGLSALKKSMQESGLLPAVAGAVEKIAETEEGATLIDQAIKAAPDMLREGFALWRTHLAIRAKEAGVAAPVAPPVAGNEKPIAQDQAAKIELPEGADIMLRHLQQMAEGDLDLEEPAQFIVSNGAPRDFVRKLLACPVPFAELARLYPDALRFPVWYGELLTLVSEKLAAP